MTIATKSSQSTGLTFLDIATCANAALIIWGESISLRAASPVRTLARPALAPASLEADQGYGLISSGLLGSYDPVSCSWKMSQRCLFEEWEQCLEGWPKSGMTRNGQAYALPMWAPRICENEYSLWPTPQASDWIVVSFNLHVLVKRALKKRSSATHIAGERLAEAIAAEFFLFQTPEITESLIGFPQHWSAIED